MVAPDSTDLVSTPESYIESEAYAMPVSRHELSGLDRLSRDVTDTLVIVKQIEQAGAHYKSLGEPAADTTSPFKEVFIAVMGMACAAERNRKVA
jgi:hypothetical protein